MKILDSFVQIYFITVEFSDKYFEKHSHRLYFTPMFFLRSLTTYRRLLSERKHNVAETTQQYSDGLNTITEAKQKVEAYREGLLIELP
jgi:hypothetical protein